MSNEAIFAIIAVVFFIAVGFLNKHMRWNATVSEFAGTGEKLKWFRIAVGLAMTFAGGAATLNMASLGYKYGWQPLIDPAAVLLAGCISLMLVSMIRRGDSNTIGELLSGDSQYLRSFYGIVSGIVYVLLAAAQFVALGKLLQPLLPSIPTSILIALPSVLIYAYIVLGGLRSVTQTDVAQFILIAVFFVLPSTLAFLGLSFSMETPARVEATFNTIPGELAAYLTFPLLFVPFSQDLAVRTKAAKSSKQAKVGIIVGVLLYALVVAAAVHIGVYARKHGIDPIDTESVVGQFFSHSFPAMHAFVAVAIAAAIASTLDSWTYSAILIVAADILPRRNQVKSLPTNMVVISAIVVLILALIIALLVQQILALILLALYVYVAVLIPSALGRRIGLGDKPLAILASLTAICMIIIHLIGISIPFQPYMFPGAHAIAVIITSLIPSCRRQHESGENIL